MRFRKQLAWTVVSSLAATLPARGAFAHAAFAPFATTVAVPQHNGQGGAATNAKEDLEQLRSQLAQPGAEGADSRTAAIELALSSSDERVHGLLLDRLADTDDPDQVRVAVLQAFARRLLNVADPVFGQRQERSELRTRLLRRYVRSLVSFWQGEVDADGLLPADPLRDQARVCVVRLQLQPRTLEDGLRALMQATDATQQLRVAALRLAGDSQNLLFGRLIAEFVEATEPVLQTAARTALRFLTFVETPFERREQFEAWYAQNVNRRYQDLAEDAARTATRRSRLYAEELKTLRREAAAEFVHSVTERRPGVDWAAVQIRTLADDPATMRQCLQQLQRTLLEALPGEDGAAARQAFARALLLRYRNCAPEDIGARAALLEVAAYLCRPTETELGTEVSGELTQQLDSAAVELQLAALRGLRRFPSPEARAVVVRLAAAVLPAGEARAAVLTQALQTLSWSKDTPWRAPIDSAADKPAWLQLVRDVCGGNLPRERRSDGLAVALLLDRELKRVPEVFDLLLDLARDRTKEPEFRTQCLIHLQDWRDQGARTDTLVRELSFLLGDDERDVRLFAAEALARLPDASEEKKRGWQRAIVLTLRERLQAESNAAVLRAMVDCLVACGRDPGTPEAVIGAINYVLDGLGQPVPQEQQFRAKTLLAVLPTVAADARTEVGQWMGACDMLLRHEERRSLRHVLESHNAVLQAKDVASADPGTSDRARRVMRLLLMAALLKPAKESWLQSDELKREAEDVRTVFAALPPTTPLPENLQDPRFRLLRLEVLVAVGKPQEALALAAAWLGEVDPKDHKPLDAAQQDGVRILAAEASLIENKNDQAADWLAQIDPSRAIEPRALAVAERTSRAFATTSPAKAVALLDRIVQATPTTDPAFRGRLVALLQARLQANPTARDEVLQMLDKHAALFQAPDCPEALKEAVLQLRAGRD